MLSNTFSFQIISDFSPQLCYSLMAWKFHSLPDARLPNVTFSKVEKKQVLTLNKSRLALTGSTWVMAQTEFAEGQSQCEQRGLYSQKFHGFCWKREQFLSCRAQNGRFEASWWSKVWSENLFPSCRGFQLPHHHFSSALIYG